MSGKGDHRGDYLSVLADVESRLEVFLTGNEPILEAQEIVRSVLEARYAEADATLAAARARATERWYEEVAAVLVLGTFLALPLVAQWYPTQTGTIFNWIEQTFGDRPGAEAATPTPEPCGDRPRQPRARRRAPTGRVGESIPTPPLAPSLTGWIQLAECLLTHRPQHTARTSGGVEA